MDAPDVAGSGTRPGFAPADPLPEAAEVPLSGPAKPLPEPEDKAASSRRRMLRSGLAIVLAAGFVAAFIAAVIPGQHELTRGPTTAERDRAAREEVLQRWRAWPAGELFPASVEDNVGGSSGTLARVIISPDQRCDSAVDQAFAATLRSNGCRAVLRATYVDPTGGIAITVGIAAFPDEKAAESAWRKLVDSREPALHALPARGTAVARFGDPGRNHMDEELAGPYVVLGVAGYADGRPLAVSGKPEVSVEQISTGLLSEIASTVSVRAVPQCGKPGWRC